MAGTTIRCWELAGVLAERCRVTLGVPGVPGRESPAFRVASTDGAVAALTAENDVVICSGFMLDKHPELAEARHLVVDLYAPFTLENLHMFMDDAVDEQMHAAAHHRSVLNRLVKAGDVFLCASERQRDYWLGWLAAEGRVNPLNHQNDRALRSLVRVVPFGLPDQAPTPAEPRIKGVVPGIGKDDFLVLWGGGIWNWFDPLTLIRAAPAARASLPSLRVLFPATASPSEKVPPMRMAAQARALSDELGLTGSTVFFGSGWIPYAERGSVLLESDVGVSLHADDVETRFSFRTRILDYLWAGVPVIATEGDSMAELVAARDLGVVVPYEQPEAVAAALVALGADPQRRRDCADRSREAAGQFTWSKVAEPLIEYCVNPVPAPDRAWARAELAGAAPPGSLGRLARRAMRTLATEGPSGLVRRTGSYLDRRSR